MTDLKPFLIAMGAVIGLGLGAVLVVLALATEEIKEHIRTLICALGSAEERDNSDYKEGTELRKHIARELTRIRESLEKRS